MLGDDRDDAHDRGEREERELLPDQLPKRRLTPQGPDIEQQERKRQRHSH
jgi:hypothetical protein